MVMEGTETDSAQELVETLSDEQENDSENQENKIWLDDEDEKVEEPTDEPDDEIEEESESQEEEPEKEEEKTYTYAELRSTVDKELNQYRETHEKDAELIRTLQAKEKDYRKKIREATNNSEFSILLQADLDDGMDEDKANRLDSLRKKYREEVEEFIDTRDELEEYKEISEVINKNMNKDYVKKYGLNDPNPYVRAQNILNTINESIGRTEANDIRDEIFEVLVAKGSELREKIDKSVTELQGLSEKNRQFAIKKLRDGLKVTPKSAPPKRKEITGGGKTTFTREEIANMTPSQYEKNREAIQAALDAGRVK